MRNKLFYVFEVIFQPLIYTSTWHEEKHLNNAKSLGRGYLPKNSTGFTPQKSLVFFSTSACGVWPRLRELATGAPLQSTAVERAALRCLRASRGKFLGSENSWGCGDRPGFSPWKRNECHLKKGPFQKEYSLPTDIFGYVCFRGSNSWPVWNPPLFKWFEVCLGWWDFM